MKEIRMFIGFIAIIVVLLIIEAMMSTGSTNSTDSGAYEVDSSKTELRIVDAKNEGEDLKGEEFETLMEYLYRIYIKK